MVTRFRRYLRKDSMHATQNISIEVILDAESDGNEIFWKLENPFFFRGCFFSNLRHWIWAAFENKICSVPNFFNAKKIFTTIKKFSDTYWNSIIEYKLRIIRYFLLRETWIKAWFLIWVIIEWIAKER